MGTLKIYQLKSGDNNRYRRWMNYDSLRKMGEMPRIENYEQVYFKRLLDNPTPEQVYWQFNQTRPADFIGHSLSTSDIIVFQSEVETIALYVDNVGYTRLPDLEKELAAAEKTPRICLEIYRAQSDVQKHDQIQLQDYQKVETLDRSELPAAGIAMRPFYTIMPSEFKDYPLSEGDAIAIRECDKAVGAFLVKDGVFARLGADFERQLWEKYEREKHEAERPETAQLSPNDSSRKVEATLPTTNIQGHRNPLHKKVNVDDLLNQAMKTSSYFWVKSAVADFSKDSDGNMDKMELLKSVYGTDVYDSLRSILAHMDAEPVGFLRYLDSGETVEYTDPDAFIAAYKEALYDMGPNAVRAITLTKDLGVHYEIEKLRLGEFGEEVPDKATWIVKHSNPANNLCAEQPHPRQENEEPEL